MYIHRYESNVPPNLTYKIWGAREFHRCVSKSLRRRRRRRSFPLESRSPRIICTTYINTRTYYYYYFTLPPLTSPLPPSRRTARTVHTRRERVTYPPVCARARVCARCTEGSCKTRIIVRRNARARSRACVRARACERTRGVYLKAAGGRTPPPSACDPRSAGGPAPRPTKIIYERERNAATTP